MTVSLLLSRDFESRRRHTINLCTQPRIEVTVSSSVGGVPTGIIGAQKAVAQKLTDNDEFALKVGVPRRAN